MSLAVLSHPFFFTLFLSHPAAAHFSFQIDSKAFNLVAKRGSHQDAVRGLEGYPRWCAGHWRSQPAAIAVSDDEANYEKRVEQVVQTDQLEIMQLPVIVVQFNVGHRCGMQFDHFEVISAPTKER